MTGKSIGLDASMIIGLAVLGCLITGTAGLIAGLVMIVGGNGIGAGLSLGASALAFGLLVNAIFR